MKFLREEAKKLVDQLEEKNMVINQLRQIEFQYNKYKKADKDQD